MKILIMLAVMLFATNAFALAPQTQTPQIQLSFEEKILRAVQESRRFGRGVEALEERGRVLEAKILIRQRRLEQKMFGEVKKLDIEIAELEKPKKLEPIQEEFEEEFEEGFGFEDGMGMENIEKNAWFKVFENVAPDIGQTLYVPKFWDSEFDTTQLFISTVDIGMYDIEYSEKYQLLYQSYLDILYKAFKPLIHQDNEAVLNLLGIFNNDYKIQVTSEIESVAEIDYKNRVIKLNAVIMKSNYVYFVRYLLLHEMLRANGFSGTEVDLTRKELDILDSLSSFFDDNLLEFQFNLNGLYDSGVLFSKWRGKEFDFLPVVYAYMDKKGRFQDVAESYLEVAKMA